MVICTVFLFSFVYIKLLIQMLLSDYSVLVVSYSLSSSLGCLLLCTANSSVVWSLNHWAVVVAVKIVSDPFFSFSRLFCLLRSYSPLFSPPFDFHCDGYVCTLVHVCVEMIEVEESEVDRRKERIFVFAAGRETREKGEWSYSGVGEVSKYIEMFFGGRRKD